ncbi:MAG: IS21 family transposase [Aureliella sp.]
MKVATWAEIRRLSELEKLSQRAIARQLGCSRELVKRALEMESPPGGQPSVSQASILDPYKSQIDTILARYPNLSAVRVREKIAAAQNGLPGYTGGVTLVRDYLRSVRPARGRVYQDVFYSPGEAIQIDWGDCGTLKIGTTTRRVSVFVAVLCYSRMCFIEFTLSQRKAEFYRALVHALEFFGGTPRKVVFDNLKAAVLSGSGRTARLHPEFEALCGHYYLEPIACERYDPESKGMVEAKVGYVKRNALQGRDDELENWDGYERLAASWRDNVANVRLHDRLGQRPIDRFAEEQQHLRPLPTIALDTDEIVMTEVRPTTRIDFDGNRYSVPPHLARKPVVVRADAKQVRIVYQGLLVACHQRSYSRRELVIDSEHRLEALKLRHRRRASDIQQSFDALDPTARTFHLGLLTQPVRASVHLRRLLELIRLYGTQEVLAAISVANEYQTFDAAYVETILHQQRRRQSLPSPTRVQPRRQELTDIELDPPDPGHYDRFTTEDD